MLPACPVVPQNVSSVQNTAAGENAEHPYACVHACPKPGLNSVSPAIMPISFLMFALYGYFRMGPLKAKLSPTWQHRQHPEGQQQQQQSLRCQDAQQRPSHMQACHAALTTPPKATVQHDMQSTAQQHMTVWWRSATSTPCWLCLQPCTSRTLVSVLCCIMCEWPVHAWCPCVCSPKQAGNQLLLLLTFISPMCLLILPVEYAFITRSR